ncbi:hypothetical protein CHELA1G11_13055 [Hyphomicrobiales bacterium]|nr:hypothetical protein CHELA1G2_11254 [Hyphomicrobiales bacterium]CAH1668989.1 hypothetical protein CHELA1G11_13055 [Hyphomicrobiales bacterium]
MPGRGRRGRRGLCVSNCTPLSVAYERSHVHESIRGEAAYLERGLRAESRAIGGSEHGAGKRRTGAICTQFTA